MQVPFLQIRCSNYGLPCSGLPEIVRSLLVSSPVNLLYSFWGIPHRSHSPIRTARKRAERCNSSMPLTPSSMEIQPSKLTEARTEKIAS